MRIIDYDQKDKNTGSMENHIATDEAVAQENPGLADN